MRYIASLITLIGVTISGPAWGQCAAAYTTDDLLGDMMMVEEGLRSDQPPIVTDAGGRLEKGIGCLNELLPQMMVGRTYRAIAAGALLGDDEGRARQWFAVAVEVDSTFDYGLEDIPAEHPMRSVYNDLKIAYTPAPEMVEGMGLAAGTHYLDGRKITEPSAVGSRPHLYQVVGDGVKSWVISGNEFPEDMLQDPNAVVDAGKKGKKPKKERTRGGELATNEFGYVARQRPPEKTPLLAAGIVAMLGAGGIYAYTFKTANDFKECKDVDCINETTDATNRLILISGGVLALGGATLIWGAMVDANGNPVPGINVRW